MRSGGAVTDYLMHRNTLLLVREHSGRYHASVRAVIAVMQLARGLLPGTPPRFGYSARGRVLGMLDFARGRTGRPPASLFGGA
jgi:hypothetical protein